MRKSIILAILFSVILLFTNSSVVQNHVPRNIILMISDGWGYNQIEATDYYQYGATGFQIYEKFPVQYAMSTYMVQKQTGDETVEPENAYITERAWKEFDYIKQKPTDSAASATAFSTGIKTYKGAICMDVSSKPLENIVEIAEKKGKATGVVTTVQCSHATPAGMVAHNRSRDNYVDIANEMIYNSGLDVIMGCGHPLYDNNAKPVDKPNSFKYVGGEETWDDIINNRAGNDADNDGIFDHWTFFEDSTDFVNLQTGTTPKRVIAIAKVYETLQQKRNGTTKKTDNTSLPYTDKLNKKIPSLEIMTNAALNILDNDEDGFFLMIEGGAVDWAGHDNSTARMIEEQIDFNKSVRAVVKWVEQNSNWNETLIIVTGDHECGYLTGPKSDPTREPIVNNGKGKLPGTEWHSGSHTNQLVPLFAKGAGSEILKNYANEIDFVRGHYLDNAEIGQFMINIMKRNHTGTYIVTD